MKTKTWSILLIISLLLIPSITAAQNAQRATLTPPKGENYPQMSVFLDAYNAAGGFLFGLTPENITLLENENPRPIQEFEELSPGVQVVVAINIAPSFAIRDELGNSRFDYLSQALLQWGENLPPENGDDLSLITNDEIEITHLNTPATWTSTLENYNPQPRETNSDLNVLAHAIEIAADTPPQQNMKQVVLLLTPSPTPEEIVALQNLTAYAQEQNVHLFAWMVTSPAFLDTPGATQLRQTTIDTGGAFFSYSGEEAIPSPESYLAPLRGTYRLVYDSLIVSSGTHSLEAIITTEAGEITAIQEFQFEVLPPNPIFVSPPLEIRRENPNPGEENQDTTAYTPTSQTLEIIIEFPDGHPRPLEETILYVDGNEEAKNTQPPFDHFTWDISNYDANRTYRLQVRAVDSLGLGQTSLETPIQITIDKPEPRMGELGRTIGEHPYALAGLGAVILAAILLLVFLRRGIIRPKAFLRSAQPALQKQITKPDSAQKKPRRPSFGREQLTAWVDNIPWPEGETVAQEANAALEPITEQAKKLFPDPIPLHDAEITFGKDASAATLVIKEASLSDLHARLKRISENVYQLNDEGSVAGTWVNYQPLDGEKHLLQHGDTVHMGRAGFLFRLQDPSTHPEVIITPQEDKL